MSRHGRYPNSVRQTAVRLVREREADLGSQWEAICAVAAELGPTPETVRGWVRKQEKGEPPHASELESAQAQIEQLRSENERLRQDNLGLKAALAILARDVAIPWPGVGERAGAAEHVVTEPTGRSDNGEGPSPEIVHD